MNKRHFLKATGITFVASLLVSPFLGRSESSSASAQEGKSVDEQIAELRKTLENETRMRNKWERDADRQFQLLSKSVNFIGAIVAIPYDDEKDIPEGWHLCDGSKIPSDEKFNALRDLIGDSFPDYRGYFLRGFDRGAGRDSGRVWGSEQNSANKKHVHEISKDAKRMQDAHDTMQGEIGGLKRAKFTPYRRESTVVKTDANNDLEPNLIDLFSIPIIPHQHDCKQDVDGAEESRPINKVVNYVIKYA